MNVRTLFILNILCLSTACSTLPPLEPATFNNDPFLSNCHEAYLLTDKTVYSAGVLDSEGRRITGFPYLRSNRFLASLAKQTPDLNYDRAWLDRLIALGRQGRIVELANLPASTRQTLTEQLQARTGMDNPAMAILAACDHAYRDHDLSHPQRLELIKARAQVPDDYSLLLRTVGLYPLTRYPVYQGYRIWKDNNLDTFTIPHREKQWSGTPVAYFPAINSPPASRKIIAGIIQQAYRPPLYLPDFTADELRQLARHYAPVFLVDEASEADRVGEPYWTDQNELGVDTSYPVVYIRIAYTWFENAVLPQLVYTLWFPERPQQSALDLLSGKLDGLIWRVTIDRDGTPLIADTIHPCGCYHLFFPADSLEKQLPESNELVETNETPQVLPALEQDKRHVIRVASISHYVEHLSTSTTLPTDTDMRSYRLIVDHPVTEYALRSMPLTGGGAKSLYAPDGLVPGTERLERWILWPMGVKSPGAMRQWGRHATAFVGRRHFDDPYLFDRGFRRAESRVPHVP